MANLFEASRGNYRIIAGEVTKVAPGKGSAEGKVVNITLSGTRYDKKAKKNINAKAEVAFWNSQSNDDQLEGKKQYADRITAAKVREGVFLIVLAIEREDGTLTGFDFKYNGVLTLRGGQNEAGEEIKDTNVILGTVTKAVLDAERGLARVTVITDGRDTAEFHNISIWDNERRPEAAENAAKYLAPYEKDGKKIHKKAVFVCGENTHFGKPDGEGNSYSAFRYDFVPTSNSASAPADNSGTPDAASAPVPETVPDDFYQTSEEELPWNQ
jgi:hypothetical protein